MLGKAEIVRGWNGKIQNVYRREVLYQEVWNFPITEVAKKYAVSDATIHKVCRSMDIPTPPVGYWAKKQAGKEVTIPPLPQSACRSVKFGNRPQAQTSVSSGRGLTVGMTPIAIDALEEAAHKQEEEKQRLGEQRKRYNLEVAKTKVLLNQTEDYDIACRIRAMVAVAEQKGTASAEWVAWAKAKADWYDPMVAAKDMYFGRRRHKDSAEKKVLQER